MVAVGATSVGSIGKKQSDQSYLIIFPFLDPAFFLGLTDIDSIDLQKY